MSLAVLPTMPAMAAPLLPAPSGSGPDQVLSDLAAGFQRQQDVFATAENGLSLDIIVNADSVDLVKSFFAQTASDDFQQVTGQHPFAVVSSFGEWGDEGNFAGIASVGVAARLMVLEREHASAGEIAAARAAAVRAAQAWHVYASIGGPGIVARGIRRTVPLNPQDPPLPGDLPPTMPLTDASGNAQPVPKDNTWRTPVASGFDGWIWLDDTSKDQVIGYAAAVTWLYDALAGDSSVPKDVTRDLANDLAAVAHALQKVAPETGVDLSIRDADGRLTDFHDLNPRELVPGLILPADEPAQNGFNALLALAVIRAAYHVSGDPELGSYYYDDLVAQRGFPALTPSAINVVIDGPSTNFSDVNMLAIAYAILVRVETDSAIRTTLQHTIDTAFWNTGNSRDCSHSMQPWFDAIYASFSSNADQDMIADRIRTNLSGFQPAPAFERDRINCDANALAAGTCIGVDGTTVITLEPGSGHGGDTPVATEPLPMSIRPDSDMEWRSDPFAVNGSGSTLMDPRGDYLAAYWYARYMDRNPEANISPHARPWPPPKAKGCRCDGAGAPQLLPLIAVLGGAWRSRRRAHG